MFSVTFKTVWPCIVSNSLWIKPTYSPNSNFIGITTLHISGSLSAHHQEFLALHQHWYILYRSDDRLLPGAGWNCVRIGIGIQHVCWFYSQRSFQLLLSIRSVNSVSINLSSINSMCRGSSVNEWLGESFSPLSSITASSLGSIIPFIRIQTPSSVSSVVQGFDLSHSLILSEFRTVSDFR
jgi:hypothetical protein